MRVRAGTQEATVSVILAIDRSEHSWGGGSWLARAGIGDVTLRCCELLSVRSWPSRLGRTWLPVAGSASHSFEIQPKRASRLVEQGWIDRAEAMEVTMAAQREITELAEAALEAESEWRYRGPDGRRSAYERFRELLNRIAELTGRPYEELFNEAIEEWVTLHFCSVPSGGRGPDRVSR
jgi:hypothetical protein